MQPHCLPKVIALRLALARKRASGFWRFDSFPQNQMSFASWSRAKPFVWAFCLTCDCVLVMHFSSHSLLFLPSHLSFLVFFVLSCVHLLRLHSFKAFTPP